MSFNLAGDIFGKPKNNKKSNLKVLCPNCHSYIHTKSIKRKPKGNKGHFRVWFPLNMVISLGLPEIVSKIILDFKVKINFHIG